MTVELRNHKLYNENNEVAVAISGGFGAGWSTWNDVSATDGEFNLFIYNEDLAGAQALAASRNLYDGGLEDCRLAWLPEGSSYRIEEYDGAESLITTDDFLIV